MKNRKILASHQNGDKQREQWGRIYMCVVFAFMVRIHHHTSADKQPAGWWRQPGEKMLTFWACKNNPLFPQMLFDW